MYQTFIVPCLYKAQHVSGDTSPIIRSLKLHWQPLVFHTWKVVWTCSWGTCSIVQYIKENPTRCNNVSNFYCSMFIWSSTCLGWHITHHQEPKTALAASGFLYVGGCWTCSWWTTSHVWKTRGCQCSFRLLMMGGVSPETCWASYEENNKILIHCCIMLEFSLWIVLWCTDPQTSSCWNQELLNFTAIHDMLLDNCAVPHTVTELFVSMIHIQHCRCYPECWMWNGVLTKP
jgi:hypothetical protein